MCEEVIETTSTARTLESEEHVIVWIDGPFETRSYRFPKTEADTFSGFSRGLDCRAILYRCSQGGGRLRALYPVETGGEVIIRYDLRELERPNAQGESTIATILHREGPMKGDEIENNWTILWNPTEEDDE